MSDEPTPLWVQAAVARISTPLVRFADEADWPIVGLAGEIRAARSMDHDGLGARLVLVLETYTDADPWINACLISAVVEAAGDKDIRLDPQDTDMSFPVTVETDVVGPLFMVQLGPRLGQVEASMLGVINAAVYGEWTVGLEPRRGMPISRREEARWRLKEEEIASMHALASHCMHHLLKVDTAQDKEEVVLDPSFFSLEGPAPSIPLLLNILSVVGEEELRLDVPTEEVVRNGRLPDWTARLSPDEVRALEVVWQGCLRGDVPSDRDEPRAHWTAGWSSPGGDLLARHLARRATAGTRAFRVLTSRLHWPEPVRSGVVALDIEGTGTVQVKPELVEAAA